MLNNPDSSKNNNKIKKLYEKVNDSLKDYENSNFDREKTDKENFQNKLNIQRKKGKEISDLLQEEFESMYVSNIGEVYQHIEADDISLEGLYIYMKKDFLDDYFPKYKKNGKNKYGSRGYPYYMMYGTAFDKNNNENEHNDGTSYLKDLNKFWDQARKYLNIDAKSNLMILDNMRSNLLSLLNSLVVLENIDIIDKAREDKDTFLYYLCNNLEDNTDNIMNKIQRIKDKVVKTTIEIEEKYITQLSDNETKQKIPKKYIDDIQEYFYELFNLTIKSKSGKIRSIENRLNFDNAFKKVFFANVLRNFREEDNPFVMLITLLNNLKDFEDDDEKPVCLGIQYGGIEFGVLPLIMGYESGIAAFSKYNMQNFRETDDLDNLPITMIDKNGENISIDNKTKSKLEDRNIILFDDNVASGKTISTLRDILESNLKGSYIRPFVSRISGAELIDNKVNSNLSVINSLLSSSYFVHPAKYRKKDNGQEAYRNVLIERKLNQLDRGFDKQIRNLY